MRKAWLGGLLAGWVLLALGACESPAQAAPAKSSRTPSRKPAGRTARKPAGKKPAKKAPVSLEDHPLISRLKQVESGPGIVVFEPIPRETDAEMAAFGAGCARVMNLIVGSQAELGRTPLWSQVARVQRELKRDDLQLTLGDALIAARMLGLTHVAVGEIQGNAEKCTLTYRVVAVAGKKTLGEPITITGVPLGIAANMSVLGSLVAQRVGVTTPRLIGHGQTAEELTALGKVPWEPREPLTNEQRKILVNSVELVQNPQGRTERPVLGAFLGLLYYGSVKDSFRLLGCAQGLQESLGLSPLFLGDLGRFSYLSKVSQRSAVPTPFLKMAREKHPNNFGLSVGELYLDRLDNGDLARARQTAEHAVRCARDLPEAWMILEAVLGQQAHRLRRGRFADDLSQEETDRCMKLYAEQLPLGLKAVDLDPKYAQGWQSLSGTAAFLGETQLADAACEQALQLDPRDFNVMNWAVQLYRPHWIDDANKLSKAARLAVEVAPAWSSAERVEMAIDLHHAKLPDLAEKVLKTEDERREYADHLKTHQR